ncbi:hypothetical protein [Sphingopyxis sp. JAI108]|uniref:hypothetical protein n=1 Tax=Sphingopyxis sp. JAI108 TaxID=2723060 RepID=UPI0015CB0943|nr:hypothetical protein [Sphingopyxis sp. JAI108]NYF32580.1 hypothetical protein [Sphingopyxis sp. JAI108]
MKNEPKKGEEAIWISHGGRAEGKIARRITGAMDVKDHHVQHRPRSLNFSQMPPKASARHTKQPP